MNVSHQTRSKPVIKKQQTKTKDEVKHIIKKINEFLKNDFDVSLKNISTYSVHVKQFFIDLATTKGQSSHFSEMFSKIANILQPFLKSFNENLSYRQSYCINQENEDIQILNKHISELQNKNRKLKKKVERMFDELQNYRIISNRHMNFIYSLKLKNIDVDYLYQKECLREESVEKKKLFSESKESIPTIQKKKNHNLLQTREVKLEKTQYPQIQ